MVSFTEGPPMPSATAYRHDPAPAPARIAASAPTLAANDTRLTTTRWRGDGERRVLETGADHVFSIGLAAARLELRAGPVAAFDGWMRPGTVVLTGPGLRLSATLDGPCDLLHLHVPPSVLQRRCAAVAASSGVARTALDDCAFFDPLAEQLALVLVSEAGETDGEYADALRQTLLTRLIHHAHAQPRALPLPKWRLRRVQALIDQRLDEPLSLTDLATAAGLSRMHFAAQFRAATGCSPHAYLLGRRVETAKGLLSGGETPLVEVALRVGFLAQSHFTTVFKRFTGETPGRWRRLNRHAPPPERAQPA